MYITLIFQFPIYLEPGSSYLIYWQLGAWFQVYGDCRKFLLLFGRIGPLALRPCALLRACGFLPHSINILQIPWWYGDMEYVLRSPLRPLARPCIFDASISCAQNPISPEDVIERTGFLINPHIGNWKMRVIIYIIRNNPYTHMKKHQTEMLHAGSQKLTKKGIPL